MYKFFRYCGRYIDDLVLINNDGHMKRVMAEIYPEELVLVPDDSDGQSCPFLDLQVVIKDSIITTSIYDKRDAFDFPIINFPTLTGNIPNRSSLVCLLVNWSAIVVAVHTTKISRIGRLD